MKVGNLFIIMIAVCVVGLGFLLFAVFLNLGKG